MSTEGIARRDLKSNLIMVQIFNLDRRFLLQITECSRLNEHFMAMNNDPKYARMSRTKSTYILTHQASIQYATPMSCHDLLWIATITILIVCLGKMYHLTNTFMRL